MKKLLNILFLLFNLSAFSQNFFTSVYGGMSNYLGDLQENPVNPLTFRPSGGCGFLYELNSKWLLRFDLTTGSLNGDDKYGLKNRARNLSFSTSLTEFAFGVEYIFFDLYENRVSPYVFLQGGVFKFSPYYKLSNGAKIILYEFDTEGQGFYKDRKKYSLRQFCVPFGGGVQWAIKDGLRVGVVVGFRKTFTDYLDDVSTTYIDKDILVQKKGGSALAVAYKGNLVPNGGPYPADGTKRGDPTNNDSYYYIGVTLRFRIQNNRDRNRESDEEEDYMRRKPSLD
ncbi:MAG: hypothetical protein FGM46_04880, partial [Ferruginibacter sp.]|nr:hypothetical protein [Ferruginibacter sp.]